MPRIVDVSNTVCMYSIMHPGFVYRCDAMSRNIAKRIAQVPVDLLVTPHRAAGR